MGDKGESPVALTLNNSLPEFVVVMATWFSAGSKGLVPKACNGDTSTVPWSWKMKIVPWPLWIYAVESSQQRGSSAPWTDWSLLPKGHWTAAMK